ncbi:MAG: hypothetical protein ACTH0V_07370 [Microbacteriaceae bacterium]|uniref:hypothetical protein n=1 Tax=Microbacterium gubbeenense TaxID=159896 RepID=UPI003F98CAD1
MNEDDGVVRELTDQSPAGEYVVETASGSTYRVHLDPDRPPRIVRDRDEPADGHGLQRDGTELPGVSELVFVVGEPGRIAWQRDEHERDDPSAGHLYAATVRSTSTVVAIRRVTRTR